jgi:hypothetical protein
MTTQDRVEGRRPSRSDRFDSISTVWIDVLPHAKPLRLVSG